MRVVLTCAVVLASVLWPATASARASTPLRITLDPGHGGDQIGTAYTFSDGTVLQEKSLDLEVALMLRQLLEQAGLAVTLTRTTDTAVNALQQDLNGDGRVGLADELQARIDTANAAGSDLFVSICFNGSSDPSIDGTETFWNPDRPFSNQNKQLAAQVDRSVVADLSAAGYPTRDRGANTDTSLLNGDSFFLLGPRSAIIARPSQMPAVIGEPLFLTNPSDATALRDSRTLAAIARGFFDGIQRYVTSTDAGPSALAAPIAHSQATPSPGGSGPWTVWAITYADTPAGLQLARLSVNALASHGLTATVVKTSTMASLRPGFLVVSAGTFGTRQSALARAAQLQAAGYPHAYVRPVPR